MHGMNDSGQLGLGDEKGPICYFFPEFMKKDKYSPEQVDILDVQFGAFHTIILVKEQSRTAIYGSGRSNFSQLCVQS